MCVSVCVRRGGGAGELGDVGRGVREKGLGQGEEREWKGRGREMGNLLRDAKWLLSPFFSSN